jgi:alpha-galactosidase
MKKSTCGLFALFIVLSGCGLNNNYPGNIEFEEESIPIPFVFDQIKVDGELGSFSTHIETHELEPGLEIVTLTLQSENPAVPPKFNLKWNFPSSDVYQFWNSNINTDKVTYYINDVHSRASSQVPLISFINANDRNRFTFAISDALNKINTNTWLREEDSKFYCQVELFSEPHPEITEYILEIRIDRRNIPFYKSISQSTEWWANMENYKPAPVPDDARMPMYSTWYSFHQNLNIAEVIRECRLGKEIGLEAVIVDDGWQTIDNKRGYAFTGDWEPDRIGDMKAFVDSIHAVGMKFLLWYSLPFIGEKAKIYPDFKGKYLHHWESQGTWVLDPRYPEVREHIITTYEKALTDWNLDGFKLDFLGWFYADEKTDMTARNGRDFASVNEATDKLMTNIMVRLRSIKPDIMIEFRQPYIGPIMRKYGNMFRAADCPNMEVVNRVRTTDLRIASGNTAVHSDMFVWHKNDPVESAALQILNILFSVPQLSVKLDSISDEQFQMATYWMNYWKENREVLLDGEFIPKNPGALYPILRSVTEKKEIIVVYNDEVVDLIKAWLSEVDIINAKRSTSVIVDFENDFGNCKIQVLDCMGARKYELSKNLKKGLEKFVVPPSGMVRITND